LESGAYLTHFANHDRQLGGQGLAAVDRILGGGVGKISKFGKLPVNTQIGAYYNVVKPDFANNWQIRAQLQFMFPK
jgi:hypothetical protein